MARLGCAEAPPRIVGGLSRAPETTYTQGSNILVLRPKTSGIPETMVCRSLMFDYMACWAPINASLSQESSFGP